MSIVSVVKCQPLHAEIYESILDIEGGIHKPLSRVALHWRSLAVRVLGVVAAAVFFLVDSNVGLVLPEGPQHGSRDHGVAFAAGLSSFHGSMHRSPSIFAQSNAEERRESYTYPTRPIEQRTPFSALVRSPSSPSMTLEAPATTKTLNSGLLSSFLEAVVHSSIWMAGCLASLVPYVQLSASVAIDWRPFWAGFFESLVVYTFDHLRDIRKATESTGSHKVGSARRVRALRALSIIGFVGFLSSVAVAPAGRHMAVFLTFGIHMLLCVAYAALKPHMPYLKAAYVSLCVVFMSVAAPAAYEPGLLAHFGIVALMRLFLLIFSVSFTIENLQDLRDIKEDKEAGVVTLPSGIGVEWTAKLLLSSQALCVALNCGMALMGVLPLRLDMLLIHVICGVCAASFSESTPRSLFQLVLEPLYVSPAVMLGFRWLLGG